MPLLRFTQHVIVSKRKQWQSENQHMVLCRIFLAGICFIAPVRFGFSPDDTVTPKPGVKLWSPQRWGKGHSGRAPGAEHHAERGTGKRSSMRALSTMACHWLSIAEHMHSGNMDFLSSLTASLFGRRCICQMNRDSKIALVLKMIFCFIAEKSNDLWVCQGMDAAFWKKKSSLFQSVMNCKWSMGDVYAYVCSCVCTHVC